MMQFVQSWLTLGTMMVFLGKLDPSLVGNGENAVLERFNSMGAYGDADRDKAETGTQQRSYHPLRASKDPSQTCRTGAPAW